MATQETVVDQKPLNLAPFDESVIIPKHVREAAAAAEAAYKANYEVPAPETPPVPPADVPPIEPEVAATGGEPVTAPKMAPPPPERSVDWEQRYNSMKGRWQANERMMGEMRAQMDQMAVELRRSQQLMQQPEPQQPQSLITPEERDTYGDDMINVARKAAIEALAPEIQTIAAQNEALKKQLIKQGQQDILQQLSHAIPNWRAIVNTNEWKDWLRLPNVYTGEVRGKVLDAAHKAANAPRVIAIFNEYVRDTIATGGQLPGQQVQEQPVVEAPRAAPAVPLASIAAPGRARPSSGELPTSTADKPIYTRQQIAKFYADSRRGAYAGRETEKHRIEADIYAAQREGRVR